MESRYDNFFTIYPDSCLITTLEGWIEAANPAAESLLWPDLGTWQGAFLSDFIADTEQDRFQERLKKLQKLDICVPTWETRLINQRGKSFLASLTASCQQDNQGHLGIYWCIQDLSKRQAAIQALQQVNRSLDQEVQRRTQELNDINQILQRKIKALQRTQQALKRQSAQEHLIDTLSNRIYQALNLDEILDTTVVEVRQFLQTDRVLLYRFKPDWSGTVVIESTAPGIMPILYTKIDEPCFRSQYVSLYEQGRVKATHDVHTAGLAPCHLNLLAGLQVRANLVVPILQNKQLWGLLIAHHCQSPRHWSPLEVELLSKLTVQVGIAIQQAELYQKWQHLATQDSLTHVANRRRFDDYLASVWPQCAQTEAPLTMVLADVDFFKQYNDTYGHPAGDECLKVVAKTMSSAFRRSNDLVARYGGEEFAALLPGTDLEDAVGVVADLRKTLKNLNLEHRGSELGRLTLSFGLACCVPQLGRSPQLLIDAADQALYQAKANGRNGMALQQPTLAPI